MGAQAVAGAVFLADAHRSKDVLRDFWKSRFPYRLSEDLDQMRKTNRFDATCAGTLPVAFSIVLESESFEECLRLAVSMGGDSDSIAAIAGSIADPLFTVPDHLKRKAEEYLPRELADISWRFEGMRNMTAGVRSPH